MAESRSLHRSSDAIQLVSVVHATSVCPCSINHYAWYHAADLLVLPSHSEGSPLVVMEALSCGTPVLATRVGGLPELIEPGRSGELVHPMQPERLAEKLGELLESPDALENMREAILIDSRDFSARRCARRVCESLRRTLGVGGETA